MKDFETWHLIIGVGESETPRRHGVLSRNKSMGQLLEVDDEYEFLPLGFRELADVCSIDDHQAATGMVMF